MYNDLVSKKKVIEILERGIVNTEAQIAKLREEGIKDDYAIKMHLQLLSQLNAEQAYKAAIEGMTVDCNAEYIVKCLEREINPNDLLGSSWETRKTRINKHEGFVNGIKKAIKIVKKGVYTYVE